MQIKPLLIEFMNMIRFGNVDVYNEFSLQHELGIFLRTKVDNSYKIQFERNVKYFNITNTIKHEIDLVIYCENKRYAIELKYPRNGQVPEQMFACLKDICFMEQLKNRGFKSTYCITLVDDKIFYSGSKQDEIYAYFRGNKPIHGFVTKPTGKKDAIVEIGGTYKVNWEVCGDNRRYYIIEI